MITKTQADILKVSGVTHSGTEVNQKDNDSYLCELGIGCYAKFVKQPETKFLAGVCFFCFEDTPEIRKGALIRHPYRL